MSENFKKLTCGVCHAYLFDDDDVVYCPVCGAPHHRSCYNSIGHCAFEDVHGTENQYKKPESAEYESEKSDAEDETVCQICGASYKSDNPRCPECGAPNFSTVSGGGFAQFDFLGGVPENTDLGGGVTAAEARRFVFTNTRRYIPKFAVMKSGKKVGWNWFALLVPSGWFLSRKMYAAGVITGILSICFTLLLLPFSQALSLYDTSSVTSYSQLLETIVSDPTIIKPSIILLAYAGIILQLILHVICAVFGDRIYRDHAIETISRIKKESDDIDYDYRKKGGANFILLLLGFFAVRYIPIIIFQFFK
ncbi:MAG: DUF2628 domain-containing protein [Clostridia bacterium]|nr:DUF2628 domain-containing protein [Clostridia bacterium]